MTLESGAETKLRLKFGDIRENGFGVIEFLVISKMAVSGNLGFQNRNFDNIFLLRVRSR